MLEPVSNRKKKKQIENDGLVITKALYGNHKKIKDSSELSEIDDNVASQILDVTIPLNFLVTEAGQLKVCSNYVVSKCKLFMLNINLELDKNHDCLCLVLPLPVCVSIGR